MSGRRWSDRWFRRGQDQAKGGPTTTAAVEAQDAGPWNVLLGDAPSATSGPDAPGPLAPTPVATAVAVDTPVAVDIQLAPAVPEPQAPTALEPQAPELTVTHRHPDVPDLAVVQEPGDVAVLLADPPHPEPEPEPHPEPEPEAEPEAAAAPALDLLPDTQPDTQPDPQPESQQQSEARADQAAAEAAAHRGGPALVEDQASDAEPDAAEHQPGDVSPRRAHLREQYASAWELGDLSAVQLAAGALLEDGERPAGLLHDLALVAVRRRRWSDALAAATAAINAATGDGEWVRRPSAALLAMAAAATGDVDAGKHAYDLLDAEPDPARAAGLPEGATVWVAVRLNPAPSRPGESRLLLDDQDLSTEIVWARAESRLTARVAVVPTPASGHRLGDLVLLSPAASGELSLVGRPVPVVDEIDRIDSGALATLDVTVTCPSVQDSRALVAAFAAAGATAQDWTATVHGLPGGDLRGTALAAAGLGVVGHDPAPGATPTAWRQRRRFGIAAGAGTARDVLAAWAAAAPGRVAGTPVEAC
ncbi:MAG: hypothetical protein U0Q15_06585 [Kineosporiaceae bacterium]